MTIVAVITEAAGRYCLESLSPLFSHVWVEVIEAAAVTVAMYCIIQFYVQIRGEIADHKPLLKVAAIKLVIFLSFWQTWVISLLTSAGAIKAGKRLATPDIKVGIPSFLLCVEMAFFAFFHFWAFSWKEYAPGSRLYRSEMTADEQSEPKYQGGFLGLHAIAEACNPWDMIKAVGRSARWLFVGRKKRMNDSSYGIPRTDTDDTIRSDPNAYSNTKLNPLNGSTAYTGHGGKPGSRGGKLPGYDDGDEDSRPLVDDQTNPFSDPHTGTGRSPYTLTGVDSRNAPSDIGVASSFGEDDEWDTGRNRIPAPAIHIRAPSDQETGVTSAPYPLDRDEEMPYTKPYDRR